MDKLRKLGLLTMVQSILIVANQNFPVQRFLSCFVITFLDS